MKHLVPLCALNLALSVGLGAFGAHALAKNITPHALEIYKTGAQYHQIHGVGALVAAVLIPKVGLMPSLLLLVGTWIFSLSLYMLAVTGAPWIGAITPVGGASLIAGYVVLAFKGASVA